MNDPKAVKLAFSWGLLLAIGTGIMVATPPASLPRAVLILPITFGFLLMREVI
jgi:hypothetical protein